MKHFSPYLFLILLLGTLCAGCGDGGNEKRIPSLKETFSKTDKKPFGAYIAFRQLETMFYRNTVRTARRSFDKTWKDVTDTASLYVCIAPSVLVNSEEVDAMMDYVNSGNDLFISASRIDEALLKRAGCELNYHPGLPDERFQLMQSTYLLAPPTGPPQYAYYYYAFQNYFSGIDNRDTKVIGVNDNGKPDYIVHFHGRGRLFLHCDPRAFSNYFLMQQDNYKYLQTAMGYTIGYPDHLYWDDYYNKLTYRKKSQDANNESFSSLGEIMKHPPLAAAFWLAVTLLLLYILFGIKRRQRMIEVIRPNENTTVTFTETIGRLYLQKKDNKNVAAKMITYFNEYIRNTYFLNTSLINTDFIMTLSRKSGVPFNKVESLYRAIHHAHNNPDLDDYQLLSLNEQIQNFYKKKT